MQRAKHSIPPVLYALRFNVKSGLYKIQEGGITYGMSLEQTRLIKKYYHDFRHVNGERPTVAQWYKDLPNE